MIENGWQAHNPAHQQGPFKIISIPNQPIQLGGDREKITTLLPPNTQAIIVHTIEGTGGITNPHAYCIRQHPPNSNHWVLLDSELNTGPTSLDTPPTTPTDIYGPYHSKGNTFSKAAEERRAPKWQDIQGHIYILPGSMPTTTPPPLLHPQNRYAPQERQILTARAHSRNTEQADPPPTRTAAATTKRNATPADTTANLTTRTTATTTSSASY